MPREVRPPRPPEEPKQPEQEPNSYQRTARFDQEKSSGKAYFQVQELLHDHPEVELSAYRLIFENRWIVTVLGEQPSEEIDEKVRSILSSGQEFTLPDKIMAALHLRRAQEVQKGLWSEHHYRPGKRRRIR